VGKSKVEQSPIQQAFEIFEKDQMIFLYKTSKYARALHREKIKLM
jgi:hypothetical protein